MSVIWRKVWRDLWSNKFRTALVVLAIAVGVFSLGFVYGTAGLMKARMTASHRESRFPHVTFYTGRFEREAVEQIRRQPGVADAEGATVSNIRWKLPGQKNWKDGTLYARDDYGAQRMDFWRLEKGKWPDEVDVEARTSRTLAVERLSTRHYQVPMGTEVLVEYGRHERQIPITGIVRHTQVQPPQIGGNATFFASRETTAWLTDQEQGFNRMNVVLESYEGEVVFRPDEHPGKEEIIIPLWKSPKGWGLSPGEQEAASHFMLLACTESLDYHQLLQGGLGVTREVLFDWNPLAVSDDWCSQVIKVRLVRE